MPPGCSSPVARNQRHSRSKQARGTASQGPRALRTIADSPQDRARARGPSVIPVEAASPVRQAILIMTDRVLRAQRDVLSSRRSALQRLGQDKPRFFLGRASSNLGSDGGTVSTSTFLAALRRPPLHTANTRPGGTSVLPGRCISGRAPGGHCGGAYFSLREAIHRAGLRARQRRNLQRWRSSKE